MSDGLSIQYLRTDKNQDQGGDMDRRTKLAFGAALFVVTPQLGLSADSLHVE